MTDLDGPLPRGFIRRGETLSYSSEVISGLRDGLYAEKITLSPMASDAHSPNEAIEFRHFEVRGDEVLRISAEEYSARVEGPPERVPGADGEPVMVLHGTADRLPEGSARNNAAQGQAVLVHSGDTGVMSKSNSEANER